MLITPLMTIFQSIFFNIIQSSDLTRHESTLVRQMKVKDVEEECILNLKSTTHAFLSFLNNKVCY